MNVLMVWDGDYPWDVRVEKICSSLIDKGCSVWLVCRNSKCLKRRENIGGINVVRLLSVPFLGAGFNGLFTFPAFFSPIWLWEIFNAAKQIKPNVIIARDLPMAPAALVVGKKLCIPVVFDMAECYPAMLRCIWQFENVRPQNFLVRNPQWASIIEKMVIKSFDAVWVMVEEAKEYLISRNVIENKIVIVSNTPPLDCNERKVKNYNPYNSPLTIIYAGLLNPSRGLRTLIRAAGLLEQRGLLFNIKIAGSGKDIGNLKRMAREMGAKNNIQFLGWIEHKKLAKIIKDADVGIVPHYVCDHWNTTIPNKLFDYMKEGLPVLVSNAKPAARIVHETHAGLVYDSMKPEALVEKLVELKDPTVRESMGRAGRDAVEQKYNWSIDSKRMIESLTLIRRSA